MMLQIDSIGFSYKRRGPQVLDGLSLTLEPGHIYGLLGKNGTGKSTLLHLMSGLLRPKSGSVTWNGKDTSLRLPSVLQEIFLVPEEFDLPAVSLRDFVRMNAPFYPRFSEEDLRQNLQVFELDMNLRLNSLSMGQKKKVYMSFALATHTSVLLMDEPTNGLDIPSKSQFRKLIASGMTDDTLVVISTHQVRDIDKMLDAVVIMDQSQILLNESISTITSRLAFVESDDSRLLHQAIYALPSVQGHQLLLPNTDDLETDVNLELLFGAALSKREQMASLFPIHPLNK